MTALRCLAGTIVLSVAGSALAGSIRIQASDQDGRPVSGARVWICERDIRPNESPASAEGVAGPNGQVLLAGLRPGFGRYRLVVSAPEYANRVIDGVFVPLGERSLPVQLVKGGNLEGWVRAENGEPVAGAKVRLQLPGWVAKSDPHYLLSKTTTGRDGRFSLPHVEGGVHGLLAEAGGAVGWRTGVRAPADGVEIVIRPGVTVTGRAGLPSDQPAEGKIMGLDVPYGASFPVSPDGRFTLRHVPPGKYLASCYLQWKRFEVGGQDIDIDLVRPDDRPGRPVRGIVKWADGTPAEGAIIECVIRYRGRWAGYRGGGWAETDPQGRFQFPDLRLPPGEADTKLALVATAEGEAAWELLPDGDGPGAVELTLRETGASLQIHVIDAATGGPLSGVAVKVNPEWRIRPLLDTTSTLGATNVLFGFITASLFQDGDPRPTGMQRAQVTDRFRYFPWTGFVKVNGPTEITVPLDPRSVFRGRVVDGEGQPLSRIRVLSPDGEADTDDRGEFTMLGRRRDAKFLDLRWSRLARLNPARFPRLLPAPDQKGVFVVSDVRRTTLRLRVGTEREGFRVALGEGYESFHNDPSAYVDHRGVVSFGPQYEGKYTAWITRSYVDDWEHLGTFRLKADATGTVTVDISAADPGAEER